MEEDGLVVDGDVLHAHKENIAPNRDGHSATALQNTFSVPRNQRQQQLAATKARFTQDLEVALLNSHDPLETYVQFVKWTIDSYPAGKSSDSGIVPLLELATRTFKDYPIYRNDFRYLNLWFQYANLVSKPHLIYAYLLANDIGIWYAQLYEEYANVLERDGSRSKADDIYRLGIARKAMPLTLLQSRYNEFMTRMLTAQEGSPAVEEPSNAQGAPSLGGRAVLGTRGQTKSAPAPISQAAQPAGNRGKIAVFVDDGASGSGHQVNEWKELDTQAALSKENSSQPTQWKGERLPQRGAMTPKNPRIAVFRDEDAEEFLSTATPGRTSDAIAIRAQKPATEAELLFQDPFKNHEDLEHTEFDVAAAMRETSSTGKAAAPKPAPPKAAIPNPTPSVVEANPTPKLSASVTAPPAQPAASIPSLKPRPFVLPDPIPGKKPEKWMFNLNLLWNEAQGKEFCIQEDRAKSSGLLNKKWAPPPPPPTSVPLKGDGAGRTMTMMREPTVTINTKAAMNDVFDMFNGTEEEDEFDDSAVFDAPPAIPASSRLTVAPLEPRFGSRIPSSVIAGSTDPPPTPTPASGSGLVQRSLSFTPFTDAAPTATPMTKAAATPRFTPFVDSAPSQPTPAQNRAPLGVKTPMPSTEEEKTGGSLSSRTPLGAPPTINNIFGSTDNASLFSAAKIGANALQEGTTPRQPLHIFGSSADAEVPPTPTPAATYRTSSRAPPVSFTIPEEEDGEDEPPVSAPTPKPKPFKIFQDPAQDVPRESPPQSSKSGQASPNTGPIFMDNVFSAGPPAGEDRSENQGNVLGLHPSIRFTPSPGNKSDQDAAFGGRAASNPTPAETSSPGFHDVFTVGNNTPIADGSMVGSTGDDWDSDDEDEIMQDHQEVSGEHGGNAEDGIGADDYRPLARFPPIHEMTPIMERTFEYTRTTFLTETLEPDRRLMVLDEHHEEDVLEHQHQDTSQRSILTEDVTQATPVKHRRASRSRASRISLAPADANPDEEETMVPNPCNPFDPSILPAVLSIIPAPFDDFQGEVCGQLDHLQKFAARKLRQSANKSTSDAVDTLAVALGPYQFEVMDKIGEGGFGAVFRAINISDEETDLDVEGQEMLALKAVRPPQLWEFTILTRIREVLDPSLLSCLIYPRALYAFKDESYLVMDHLQYGTLLDCVNRAPGTAFGSSTAGEGLVEPLVMFFTAELFKIVEGLHSNGFIHGDLKIDNCLVRSGGATGAWASQYNPSGANGWGHHGVCLIDFGRAIDTNIFPEDQQYIGDWPTDARDCVELREGRPWTYETDYFGLAGIIYCMLFKKYIATTPASTPPGGRPRYKLSTPLKRYWNTGLWNRVFDLLLNPLTTPDTALPIPEKMRDLRLEMEAWLVDNSSKKNLKGLLKKVWLSNST